MSRDVRNVLHEAAPHVRSRPDLEEIESRAVGRRCRRLAGTAAAGAAVLAIVAGAVHLGSQGQPVARIVDQPDAAPTPSGGSLSPSETVPVLPGTPPESPDGSSSKAGEAAVDNVEFDTGPLQPRGGHSVVWTGRQMIVWGGAGDERGRNLFDDGAAFDPDSNSWQLIAPAPLPPRHEHIAVWTGEEMLVVGGGQSSDGAAYDPESDTWRNLPDAPFPIAAPQTAAEWVGDRLVLWDVGSDQVAAYSPERDEWAGLPGVGMDVDRGVLRWSGEAVYALGTQDVYPDPVPLQVARLTDGEWQGLPDANFSTPDYEIAASAELTAWVDGHLIAWSDAGTDGPTMLLNEDSGTWTEAAPTPVNGCEATPSPLEMDNRVLAFGWCGNSAIYEPNQDDWTTANIDGTGQDRYAVWTGSEVLVWGDTCCYGDGQDAFTVRAWRYTPPDS